MGRGGRRRGGRGVGGSCEGVVGKMEGGWGWLCIVGVRLGGVLDERGDVAVVYIGGVLGLVCKWSLGDELALWIRGYFVGLHCRLPDSLQIVFFSQVKIKSDHLCHGTLVRKLLIPLPSSKTLPSGGTSSAQIRPRTHG